MLTDEKILTQTVENKTDIFNHKNEKARVLDLSMDRSGLHTVIKTQFIFTPDSVAEYFCLYFLISQSFKILSELKAHILSGKYFLEKFGLPYLKELKSKPQALSMKEIIDQIDFIKLKLFAV